MNQFLKYISTHKFQGQIIVWTWKERFLKKARKNRKNWKNITNSVRKKTVRNKKKAEKSKEKQKSTTPSNIFILSSLIPLE